MASSNHIVDAIHGAGNTMTSAWDSELIYLSDLSYQRKQASYALIQLSWVHANKRIFKLQKKAVRIIYKERRLSHTDPIFKNLNLLKINDIYRLQLLKLFFKCKQNLLPVYFDLFDLTPNYRVHQHNTRKINKIHEPYVRHDFVLTWFFIYLIYHTNENKQAMLSSSCHGFMQINGFLNYRKKQCESYIKNVASLIQIQYLRI